LPVARTAVHLRQELHKESSERISEVDNGSSRDKLVYIYTSGTTGLPKAAVITQIRFFFMSLGLYYMTVIREDDVLYDPLPLYHSAGGMLGVGQQLLKGITVVIRRKFSASNFWKDCAKYKCTVAQYIGELCRYLLAQPQSSDVKHTVRMMSGNGLKPQIWEQFRKRFGVNELYEFYGSTEGNSNLVNLDSTPGAVGFVPRYASLIYPVTLIRCDDAGNVIRNASGRCTRCAPGEPGVFIGKINRKKAVNQFAGYVDKSATEKKILQDVFKEGDMYFNSGDVLVMDELGYYYFKDRTGDTFRWKGENVATSEVEGVISNILNLNDATVYGVEIPHTDGRAGMAAIVDTENVLDLELFTKGIRASLPTYAQPIFLRVMKSLPLTGTFKLKKVDLQKEGFDVAKITDKLFFFDPKLKQYVELTQAIHDDICSGKIRL